MGKARVCEPRRPATAVSVAGPDRLAVFDLDRTLLPGTSIVALALGARGEGVDQPPPAWRRRSPWSPFWPRSRAWPAGSPGPASRIPSLLGGSLVAVVALAVPAMVDAGGHRHAGGDGLSGVPAVYFFLTMLPDVIRPDVSSLRFAICGAAPMPADAIVAFEERPGASRSSRATACRSRPWR